MAYKNLPMQLDWNIEEISKLKQRAGAHLDHKTIAKYLDLLEVHLKNHQQARSFELRKTIWEEVEARASKLDILLERVEKK